MIIDERMVTYINSLDTGHTPFLENLERTAKQDRVPIIRREMQSFLKVFLKMKQPKRILEVGTAVGFSAVFMAQYGEADAEITTIENYEKRIIAQGELRHLSALNQTCLVPTPAGKAGTPCYMGCRRYTTTRTSGRLRSPTGFSQWLRAAHFQKVRQTIPRRNNIEAHGYILRIAIPWPSMGGCLFLGKLQCIGFTIAPCFRIAHVMYPFP